MMKIWPPKKVQAGVECPWALIGLEGKTPANEVQSQFGSHVGKRVPAENEYLVQYVRGLFEPY